MAIRSRTVPGGYRRTAQGSRWWAIPGSFALAMLLTILPYPEWMRFAVPHWVSLVLFYWCLAVPERVGVGSGWLAGLVLDLLLHTLFGVHALALAFVATVGVVFHRRIRMYHLWQQCVIVFGVCVVEIGFVAWVFNLTSNTGFRLVYWQAALTTALVWPVVYTLLRFFRQRSGMVQVR